MTEIASQPRILGLIPARGGSRRLPRKNVLPLAGKPLIAWSIGAAQASSHIDSIIVTTDDEEIAQLCRENGTTVLPRPKSLASDSTSSLDVMIHALRALEEQHERYDYLLLLQPTSPLRSSDDIDAAIQLLLERQADAVVSVCKTDHPPEWSNTLPDNLSMAGFFSPGIRGKRSQDLPTRYRLNGAIYIFNCQRLLHTESLDMDDNCYAYVMPRERSVDIDTALDFDIATLFMQRSSRGVQDNG